MYSFFMKPYTLKRTCQNENRRHFMDKTQSRLCLLLDEFEDYFSGSKSCKDWPENFFLIFDKPNDTLVEEMYQYGRENLALIHVMIQSPYVTKIKRDVAMKLTGFIANTGGLLGLCLGFSFISCIEFFFWCGCYCFKSKCSH